MTPEQKRIAIAKACGWKNHDHPDVMALKVGWAMPEKWCMNPQGVLCLNHDRPDYLNDLNAMHEAEKVLTEGNQKWNYIDLLHRLVGIQNKDEGIGCAYATTFSTAAQRAEAFLRTLNLRKDEAV
jgi:hypothetical protein